MKYAIVIATEAPENDPVLYRGNIFESMKKASLAGFDAVEIHARSPHEFDKEALLEYCNKTGMQIAAFATGMAKRIDGLSFIDDSEDIRNLAVKRVIEFVYFASSFSAGVIIGSLRGVIPDKAFSRKYYDRFYDCISNVLACAEKLNVPVLLEVINRYENNYLNTAEETLEFIRPLDSKMLKVHLDTFHMNIEETDMYKAIRMCEGKLGHIHLADNTRYYPGSGTINFGKVFDAARSIGYQGYFSLECLTTSDPDTTVRLSMEYLSHFR